MKEILRVLPMLPIAAIVTLGVYAVIYWRLAKKRQKPSSVTIFSEYVFTGWVVMFVYITQLMSFGDGWGIDLIPFDQFLLAYEWGSNNAHVVGQFFLNVVMFVPFGILLPIVWKKCNSWKQIMKYAFFATFATELIQIVTMRGSDIDDLIANTLGAMFGYACYRTGAAISCKKYKMMREVGCAVLLAVVIALPYGFLFIADAQYPYGSVYYGHLRPTAIEMHASLEDKEMTGRVYKAYDKMNLATLKEKLCDATGMKGAFKKGEYNVLELETNQGTIYIEPNLTWVIWFTEQKKQLEGDWVESAIKQLETFGISSEEIAFDSKVERGNKDVSLQFKPVVQQPEQEQVQGTVSVTITKDGKIKTVSDYRKYFTYVETVNCISQKEAATFITQTGLTGIGRGTALLDSVEADFAYNEETGYLVPTWRFKGQFVTSSEWAPNIYAIKKK